MAGDTLGVLPRRLLPQPPLCLPALRSVRMAHSRTPRAQGHQRDQARPAPPSDSGLDTTAVWLSRQQGLRVPWDRARPPTTGLRVGTHGKAAMAASRVNTAALSLAGPTHEKGAGAGSRCLRQNSVGDSPGGEMPSGRSALEETKRQGVCPSM